MAKKKDKKQSLPMTPADWGLQACMILGALTVLTAIIPAIPWRKAKANHGMGTRFTSDRYVSLISITNHIQQSESWTKMRRDICMMRDRFLRPDPASALISVAGSELGAGAAATGCKMWKICREHVAVRCSAYTTMLAVGMVAFVLMMISAILGMVASALHLMEGQAGGKKKKKKDKEEAIEAAKMPTMILCIVSFVLSFASVLSWWLVSDMTFKSLKETAYYPYPANYIGVYLAFSGMLLLGIGALIGTLRFVIKKKEPGEGGEGEEYAEQMLGPGGMPLGMGMGMGMGMGAMRTQGMRTQVGANPGDWQCPNADCLNHRNKVFAKHSACPACGMEKPEEFRGRSRSPYRVMAV